MFEAFFVAALLTATDPAGDAVGDGSLEPPSAAVYRNLAPFDLRQVSLTDDPQLTLEIEMGSLSDPFALPLGFSLPVIEVYLSGTEGGRNELLPGSGMRLPPEQGWEVAVRLTGEQATAYRVNPGPRGVETAPAGVTVEGNHLLVTTPFPRPDRPRLYAITGLYDLFGATPWRPVDPRESPWAFSSESQRLPVIDVLARNDAGQSHAIETGVLTSAGGRGSLPGSVWLALMALGLLVALSGVALRVLTRPRPGVLDPGALSTEVPEAGDSAPAAARAPATERGSDATVDAAADIDRAASQEPPAMPFTWDSSALLTEPDDEDEFAEDFENEFRTGTADQPSSKYTTDAWQRPVPLPLRPSASWESGTSADDDEEPEVVRDQSDDGPLAHTEEPDEAVAAPDEGSAAEASSDAATEESVFSEVSEPVDEDAEDSGGDIDSTAELIESEDPDDEDGGSDAEDRRS